MRSERPEQVERTKRHYDKHAPAQVKPLSQQMRQRNQGIAFQVLLVSLPVVPPAERCAPAAPARRVTTGRPCRAPCARAPRAFTRARRGPPQLKDYHNRVKRALIDAYAAGATRFLDLACGRGGDLCAPRPPRRTPLALHARARTAGADGRGCGGRNKWNDAGVREVVGIDLSPQEINEAARRFSEMRARGRARALRAVDFRQSDEVPPRANGERLREGRGVSD